MRNVTMPGKWKAMCMNHHGWSIYDADSGGTVCRAIGPDYGFRGELYAPYHCDEARDAMKFAAAAVNACREAGYSTEELEAGVVKQQKTLYYESKKAFDRRRTLLAEYRKVHTQAE